MCVQCLKDQAAIRAATNREARIKRNNSLIRYEVARTIHLTDEQYNTVLYYADLIKTASPEIVAQCVAFISNAHATNHTLNKYALNELLDYRDGQVQNYGDFDVYESDVSTPYIKLLNNWYDASEVMEVLRDLRPSVKPTPPELFKYENYPA